MPLTPQQPADALDTSELAVGGAVTPQLPALPDDQDGTGANSPKYSPLDVWASATRSTFVGKLGNNADLRAAAGYNFMNPGPKIDPETAIPEEMLPWKDKYVGLDTAAEIRFRTLQLKQGFDDARVMQSSKWGALANIAMGQSDPVALASLAIPIAGETRLANAVRMAAVGAGVSATDEVLMHQMDPTSTYEGSAVNIGAGTLLSGLMGGLIRPHIPAESFEQLKARLQQDFQAPPGQAPVIPEGDNAAAIAHDLRMAVETHDAQLAQTAQAHGEAVAGLSPEEVSVRARDAQERVAALETGPEARPAEAAATAKEKTPLVEFEGDESIPHEAPATEAPHAGRAAEDLAHARAELDRAVSDQENLTRAQASQEELARFRAPAEAPHDETPVAAVERASTEPQGYHVDEQEMSDELRQRFEGLRSQVHPAEGAESAGRGESGQPVPGRSPGGPARRAEGAGAARGEPHPVYRGGRGGPLTPEHFLPESFGAATQRPSSGLGVFFTNDKAEAAIYGKVTTHHLDLRNPLELPSEDVPAFDSIADATAWRDKQIAAGHDGLVIDASHVGGQTWYVPFKFEQVLKPAGAEAAAAVAHTAQLVQKAPSVQLKRAIGDPVLREQLQGMADTETGWAQEGGRVLRDADTEQVTGRTSWIPNAEWWPGRPGGYNTEQVQNIIRKALAGERLGPKQQALVEYMTEVADARLANEPYLPHAEAFEGLDEHLHAGNVQDEHETAMVTRLSLIDEAAVENLARHFEEDHVGFLREVKRTLDAHDQNAGLARGLQQERDTPGPIHRPAPERSVGPAERAGESASAPALELEHSGSAPAAAEPARKPVSQDLFGARPEGQQALADETRRRDALRNGGQESLETGRPDDLFSQSRRQVDLTEQMKRLPPDQRAQFEARLAALDSPPIIAAPGDSTAGAMQVGADITLKDLNLARGGRVLGKTLGWFAPGSRVLRSPSLEVRKAVISLMETPEMLEMNVPTPERPNGIPTPPAVETLLKRWEGKWAQGFAARDALYRQYRAREVARVDPLNRKQFNEEVSHAMRRGDVHGVPEVQQAAQQTRKLVFDPLKAEAQKMGLLPPQDELSLGGTAESYLMRQYNRAAIKADRTAWHTLLRDGFRAQNVDTAEADGIAHQVTRNLLGSEMGLLDMNDVVFKDIVPQSGRLQSRTLLLPDQVLEKYLVNDIDSLSHSYLKSLAPQVEVTRRFGDRSMQETFKNVTDEYEVLMQRELAKGNGEGANQLSDRLRADLRDLAAMRDRMYGIFGVPSDPSGWWQRAGRVIRSVNAFRMLGTATWSHIPDAANVVMRHGLPGTMAAAAKLSTSLEALKLNRTELQRLGTALDMVHNSTAAQLGEFGVESNYKFQKFLNRGTRAFTIATLETPWIASIKAVAGAVAHDQILETAERAAGGGRIGNNERIRMNQAGLSQGMLERIAAQYQKYGRQVNGLRFGMTDKWDDAVAQRTVEAAINRAAEASTLSPSKGDTPLWTSSEVGKSIFQFKTFGAVAIRKVLIPLAQGLAHADLRSAQGLATLVAAGAATYTMKQLLSGQPIEKDPKRYALEVLDKSNLLGWTGEYFYPMLWQAGMQNFSRWGDRQTWETLGGPVAGTAVDAWDLRIPAKIRGQMSSSYDPAEAHFSRADIHRIRRLLPGNQVWYLRQAVNTLEGHVGDQMGLPPAAPPRGSD